MEEPIALRKNFSKAYSAAGQAAKRQWQRETLQKRAVSGMWSLDSFDPFQIFQVKHRECHILRVYVDKGVNISKGWLSDFMDMPDPYLILSVPGTPNGRKHTVTIDNNVNPVWGQEFEFYLDPAKLHNGEYKLELVLMDANYTKDGEMGRHEMPLDATIGPEKKDYTAVFAKDQHKEGKADRSKMPKSPKFRNKEGAKIFLKVAITKDSAPDLRYSLALSNEEKTFLRMRREKIMVALNTLLPEVGPDSTAEVPMIGLIGSGGGFRALVAMSGVCAALQDEKIIDCLAYVAGLSGSSWYLSYIYAQPDFPGNPMTHYHSKLREAISKDWKRMLFKNFLHYSRELINKKTKGQPVSFTDIFGHMVGELLLGPELKNSTLTDQQKRLEKGNAPMPMYTCINVKKNVSAKAFQDWIEFSPFEVGMAKYGSFMKPEEFGSKFFVGKILKRYPEYPLHFLQGVWGSAFCKLLKWHIRGDSNANQLDFTATSDESVNAFRDQVEALENNNNRTSVQMEKDIERNLEADDNGNATNKPEESESSAEEMDGSSDEEERAKAGKKLHRKGGVKQRTNAKKKVDPEKPNSWESRRQTVKSKKQDQAKSFWGRSMDAIFCSEILDTREGRAGMIFNPLRGINMEETFEISPFHPTTPEDNTDFVGLYEQTSVEAKRLYLVDSGLTFNFPFPLLLRPQRAVDLYLCFDFSTREKDEDMPFNQLIVSEKWAKLNHVPFPPVEQLSKKFAEEPLREHYIFDDPEDPQCPTILLFVMCNKTFRDFKEPGVPRETKEEKEFADFEIFGPETPYSILNFQYTNEQFDRLNKLMEYNTKLGIPMIKEAIERAIEKRKKLAAHPQPPISLTDLPTIRFKTKAEEYEAYRRTDSNTFSFSYYR
ncbi:Hypothetical predicted protein [Cloeon dipterum]|uniref:Phospholipase A2 n=1 Tax=Cloeon dipterum TaxID=197152 RepID=A0A8S1D9K9_9INSE|nr:Hypothetical predicted protein [Cloeon dipterum]